jgi:transcriptional regulator with XRE-family HTH domain
VNELAALREDLGLAQEQLAALLAIAPSTLSHWEAGRRCPAGLAGVALRNLEKGDSSARRDLGKTLLGLIEAGELDAARAALLWAAARLGRLAKWQPNASSTSVRTAPTR